MEIFRDTNFDFLGKKWPFIIVSLVLFTASIVSLVVKGGPRYGIDFRGGTLVDVQFRGKAPVEKIRSQISDKIPGEVTVQSVGAEGDRVLIGTEQRSSEQLGEARQAIISTLSEAFGQPGGKLDFNNAGVQAIVDRIRDPLIRKAAGLSEPDLQALVQNMVRFRDSHRSGLLSNFQELSSVPGVTPTVIQTLNEEAYLAPFQVKGVEIVGPKVGAELRTQAVLATLYALGGMLVYVAVRFEWIYGVAAVLAVFHDTIITIGFFSFFDREISLTVIAALLTLVGYSMNDTIVIFDRIRENLKILRREKLESLVNLSVNQMLSRTILTNGLTFITVLALFLFGGEVLNNFAFALVVGMIIGTYSTVFIASPIVVWWQNFAEKRKGPGRSPAASPAQTPAKSRSGR
ncbi:MAG: protein translocase subunit SecF [Rhodospirillales bacterium]